MPNLKNIKRNKSRPHASRHPFVASMMNRDTEKRIEAENKKLDEWNNLSKK